MTSITRTIAAGGTALALALTLAACGGSDQGASTETPAAEPEEVVEVSHDPEVEPSLIDPGWLYGDNTSDIWWPNGDASASEGLYFTNAANDAGLDVTFVGQDDSESSVWDLEVVDGHLVTKADAADRRQVDITFQDNFTCYDAVSDTVYIRGDRSQEEYNALLEGTTFVEDPSNPDDFMVTFDQGGKTTQYQGSYDPLEGTWQVVTTNVVVCHYKTDTSEWDTTYRFQIGDGDVIAELDSGAPTKLQRYEQ